DWQVNSSTTQSGGGMVPNQPIDTEGTYQLFLTQMGCTFDSNMPHIVPDINRCPPNPCNFKPDFKLMEIVSGGFMYSVTLTNPSSSPVVVSLISFDDYGTIVPSTHVLNLDTNTFIVY